MKKNPWIAAILNFIIFGTGYIYNGKRKGYGIALALGWVVVRTADIRFFLAGGAQCTWFILMAGLAVFQFTFAIDGYHEAKAINGSAN